MLCLNRECISASSLVFRHLFHQHASQLCSLSHVFPVSCIPCLISFASHVVRYLICFMSQLRSYPNPQAAQAVSQIMSRLQATSHNKVCVTRVEIGDSQRNKMYIERADILYSVELWDESHNSTYLLMRFSLYLLTPSITLNLFRFRYSIIRAYLIEFLEEFCNICSIKERSARSNRIWHQMRRKIIC